MIKDLYVDYATFASKIKHMEVNVLKLDIVYNQSDHRCWTAVINPGRENIVVTFHVNKYGYKNSFYFDILFQDKVYLDIYVEDIYDVIQNIIQKSVPDLSDLVFNNTL